MIRNQSGYSFTSLYLEHKIGSKIDWHRKNTRKSYTAISTVKKVWLGSGFNLYTFVHICGTESHNVMSISF